MALVRNAEVGAKFDNSMSQVGISECMALDRIIMSIQSASPNGTSGHFVFKHAIYFPPYLGGEVLSNSSAGVRDKANHKKKRQDVFFKVRDYLLVLP